VAGGAWLQQVTAAMAALRRTPPTELAGRPIDTVEDLLPGHRLPSSDVLIWTVPGGRAVLRPSGTEPKVKCYAEAVVPVADDLEGARTQAGELVVALLDSVTALLVAQGL
jgi:phosphomannomutase